MVGSASVLLFPTDRDAIVNRVDNFWRTMKTEYEMTFITMREPQKVTRQLKALDARIRAMGDDPALADLKRLAQSERDVLEHRVGMEFRSLHQYLLVKAKSIESLNQGRNMLQAEVEGSTYMFKRVQALYDTDEDGDVTWELTDVFRSIYGPLPRRGRRKDGE